MVEIARDVCGSVRVGGKIQMSVWWNDESNAAVERKEATWKVVLEAYKEDREKKIGR